MTVHDQTGSRTDESPYEGLSHVAEDELDTGHWAFGTGFEDPLAGVDTTVPEGVDPAALATYCLMLGDDALVTCQRLAEWSSRAPDLEEDIALTNVALDLLGQARLLLARAASADPAVVPVLPEGSPVPPEDALAFFRDDLHFRSVRMAELPNGDFAETMLRLLLLSTWRLAVLERLRTSRDAVLSAIAVKGVKELAYHRDLAARWVVTLAQGTEESRRRTTSALASLWPWYDELFDPHEVTTAMVEAGVLADVPGAGDDHLRADVDAVLDQVFAAAGLDTGVLRQAEGAYARRAGVSGRTGRDGMHTESLSRLLAEMQSVARAHPQGQW